MLINKHDCYNILFEMQSKGQDVHKEIKQFMTDNTIPKCIVKYLKEINYPTVSFYMYLNNKSHKLIKELLTCEGKPISAYIKIATSLITQAVIAIEHTCQDSIENQNNLIEGLGLANLAHGLNVYFTSGDSSELVTAVLVNRQDVKAILDD